ncbi:hypothetical protein [Fuchsiella alkaliacetigena]|uniref:hypothetical protein n=1 Tax=Fuchsiella alkaliacetigena TaxID=957042 RepID=UPI00200A5A2B|nr:hypothetical protein [Fuchsiella alkaliacetigena]MCK8824719.1 hypothetical protein [Fuchsiella alkaliacetigena]
MPEETKILRCIGKKNDGSRCTREKEFAMKKAPEEWRCWQHPPEGSKKTNKSNEVGQNKLTDNQKEQLILWLAEGKGPKDIVRLIEKEFEMSFAPATICYYKKKYQDKILKKQKEIEKYISINVKLANKTKRIEELDSLYQRSLNQNKLDTARRVLKLIAEEMGELEQNINLNTTAKEGIMAAYKRRKERESNDQ